MVHLGFPDLSPKIKSLTIELDAVDGDVVTLDGKESGTNTGPLFGQPATGKFAKWSIHHEFRVRYGKIVEHWGSEDTTAMLQQLHPTP